MTAIDREVGFLWPGGDARFWNTEQDLLDVLQHQNEIKASDIYFTTGRPVTARVHGRLVRLTRRRLDHEHVRNVANWLYGGDNAETEIRQGKALDNAYTFPVSRFESLRYRWCATGVVAERGFGINIIMRELAGIPPALDTADLGDELMGALFPDDGLVLVCGATGAGKSTLLAGVIRYKAEDPEADSHIITYESPVEYVFHGIKTISCEIEQSALPDHLTGGFADAIRNALRRDPDIILVGESRDAETIKASVLAAQTGHALYTTVHANSVGTVFLRLIQTLPVAESASVIGSIIDSVRVIICQQLLPSTDGKRVAVREYLICDADVRLALLRAAVKGLSELPSAATQQLRRFGQTKSAHARRLVEAGRLAPEYLMAIERDEARDDAELAAESKELSDGAH
ncbi:MAG: type IV pilus twitching motility protein PilT [Rhodanobacter sp.]